MLGAPAILLVHPAILMNGSFCPLIKNFKKRLLLPEEALAVASFGSSGSYFLFSVSDTASQASSSSP